MKGIEYDNRRKYLNTAMAIAEGIWNGVVVSGVMAISVYLIDTFWIF